VLFVARCDLTILPDRPATTSAVSEANMSIIVITVATMLHEVHF
jgi:hypothetical protein